jgi:hypothetical protein
MVEHKMKKEIQNELDFNGHIINIEDAQNVELPIDEKTLNDKELEQAGLIKTSAFVRTKRSKNALRVEKNKQKKEQQGIKQLNIEVPEQHRETMKQLAIALKNGQSITDALKTISTDTKTPEQKKTPQVVTGSVKAEDYINYATIGQKVAEIKAQGGIRAFLLNRLI